MACEAVVVSALQGPSHSGNATQEAQTNEQSSPLVLVNIGDDGTALVTLNRSRKRNALSTALIADLVFTLQHLDSNRNVRVIVLAGPLGGPFSSGADLSELKDVSTSGAYRIRYLRDLSDGMARLEKPVIAAVEGFALGGGFELALMCDIIYATDSARFGLPEVTIGTIPGLGGTQRLTKIVGKHLASKMILTGIPLSAPSLASYLPGLQVLPAAEVLPAALQCARDIARNSQPVVSLARQAILAAERAHNQGFEVEKALYYASFDLEDKKEGMTAFLEKRKPQWSHR